MFYDIYLYTLCYYICCLLGACMRCTWLCSLKPGVTRATASSHEGTTKPAEALREALRPRRSQTTPPSLGGYTRRVRSRAPTGTKRNRERLVPLAKKCDESLQASANTPFEARGLLSGTIIRGTLKTPNSQLVTPISIKLQRPDGCD